MGARTFVRRRVIHRRFNVLDQGTGAPDIQGLQAIADAKHRLVHVVGILKKQFVSGIAQRISLCRLLMPRGAVFLRINIGLASRQQDSRAAGDALCYFFRRQPQRNDHGFTAGILDSTQIEGQRAMAVFGIVRAGFRNGDTGLHRISF